MQKCIQIFRPTAKKLLQYERILLNLLQRLVGISTLTKKYADIIIKEDNMVNSDAFTILCKEINQILD